MLLHDNSEQTQTKNNQVTKTTYRRVMQIKENITVLCRPFRDLFIDIQS